MLLLFLFVYVYLLTIFKGDRHLAVVDVDSIDELADIGFVVGFKRAGKSVEHFTHCFNFFGTLFLKRGFCKKRIAFFPESDDLKP